jgi:ferritin-like metal-binding protein YciE
MPTTSLEELFIEELRDVYDAEKRLLKALPKMAKAAESQELQTAFTMHRDETEGQVERLQRVFETLGEKARGKKCDGMIGIIEEGNHAIEKLEGAVLDAALIAGAQKAEHYEIATYGTLAYFAELLGNDEAKQLLGETLEEEKATDEKLTQLAQSDVNRQALIGNSDDDDEAEESAKSRRAVMEMAHDRLARRSPSRGKRNSRRSR